MIMIAINFVVVWDSCVFGSKPNWLQMYLLIINDVDPPSLRTIRVSEPSELGEKAILFRMVSMPFSLMAVSKRSLPAIRTSMSAIHSTFLIIPP